MTDPLGHGLAFSPGDVAMNSAGPITYVLWQNALSAVRGFWPMSGYNYLGGFESFGKVPWEWDIAALADFTGDGKKDIVWQNKFSGARGVWPLDGTTYGGGWVELGRIPVEWDIAAAADFNADGATDILWQNRVTGARGIWTMNGVNPTGWIEFGHVPLAWDIAGAGDFNGDDKPDILWQNTVDGSRGAWPLNGTVYSGGWHPIANLPVDWRIMAVGDFSNDSGLDWVVQNIVTGDVGVWQVSSLRLMGPFHGFPRVNSGWSVAAVFDFPIPPTPSLPIVTTQVAENISSIGALLRGQVNMNGTSGEAWLEYSLDPELHFYTSTPSTAVGTSGTVSLTQQVSGLSASKPHYFRVAASNGSGTSKGTILSFVTLALPNLGIPELTAPANGSTSVVLNPILRWSSISGASVYRVMVATSESALPRNANASTCSGCIINTGTIDPSLPLEGLVPGTTYYWQIAARNVDQFGEWSPVWSFTAQPCDDCKPE
jgi:hypothetical protein